MAKREIRCDHNIPISTCGVHYPKFLQETSVGDYVDNPLGFSNDAIVHSYAHQLLTVALNFNAAVIESAAIVISAGELKRSSHKRVIADFKRLHKDYADRYEAVVKEIESKLAEDGYGR